MWSCAAETELPPHSNPIPRRTRKPQTFRPSIPNLVYQYCLYTSYPSEGLDCVNEEITEIIEQKHVELRGTDH